MKSGKIIIILGVSASGKTYYKESLTKKFNLYLLRRVITKQKKKNENNSIDINVSKEQFKIMKKRKAFFIFTKINKDYYGYLKEDLQIIEDGINAIGDCYYKLIKKLRKIMKDRLIIICLQPYNLEKTIEKIVRERDDYKKRVKDAKKEYKFYKKNKDKIDFMVYTDYSTKTDEKVNEIMNKILRD